MQNALDAVDADTTSFEVTDEHSVSLGFQITSPPGSAVACAIEAQDEEHGVVGWRVVELPASDLHARAFREVIPTRHSRRRDSSTRAGFCLRPRSDVVCRDISRIAPWP